MQQYILDYKRGEEYMCFTTMCFNFFYVGVEKEFLCEELSDGKVCTSLYFRDVIFSFSQQFSQASRKTIENDQNIFKNENNRAGDLIFTLNIYNFIFIDVLKFKIFTTFQKQVINKPMFIYVFFGQDESSIHSWQIHSGWYFDRSFFDFSSS